jgi:hypothetical protein
MPKKTLQELPSDNQLILERLDQIAKSLAYLVIRTDELKDMSNQNLIPVLAQLGFDRNFIAQLLQTTPDTVSVRLSQLKSKSKGKAVGIGRIEKSETKV